MKALLRKYNYLVTAVLFLLVMYAIVPSMNYSRCLGNQKFREVITEGVVINKYLDRSQHSTPIVEIKNFVGRTDSIYFFGDHSGLYDRIQISDTLKKESGSNEILIRLCGKYVQFGVTDFACDSAKLENEKFLFWVYDLFGTVPPDNTLKDKPRDKK